MRKNLAARQAEMRSRKRREPKKKGRTPRWLADCEREERKRDVRQRARVLTEMLLQRGMDTVSIVQVLKDVFSPEYVNVDKLNLWLERAKPWA